MYSHESSEDASFRSDSLTIFYIAAIAPKPQPCLQMWHETLTNSKHQQRCAKGVFCGLQIRHNVFPATSWQSSRCSFHPWNDLYCVEWDVKQPTNLPKSKLPSLMPLKYFSDNILRYWKQWFIWPISSQVSDFVDFVETNFQLQIATVTLISMQP